MADTQIYEGRGDGDIYNSINLIIPHTLSTIKWEVNQGESKNAYKFLIENSGDCGLNSPGSRQYSIEGSYWT